MTGAKHPRPPFRRGDPAARELGRRGGETAQRRASKGPWRGTILDLMDAAGMVGAEWTPWRAFWRAVYALPMMPEELSIFQRHTKRDAPPQRQVAEAWMCIGRGGGKTRNSALHATFRAISFDAASVDPGEDVVIPLLASDRRQSRSALKYLRAFNTLPVVAPYVHRGGLKETIEYRTGVNVEVQTASKAAPRGYACPTACADEIAFWENEDDHTNPDREVITAVRGALGRVQDSVLVALSNPYAPKGELYDAVATSFGRDDADVLVWNADTLSMNPTYDRRAITRAFTRDPVVAMSEFGMDGSVAFRQAKQALFDADAVAACIVADRFELPPQPGLTYVAFVDAAQGQRAGDPMTLGIAHRDGTRAVLDLLREVAPPFNPADVVTTFAAILQRYGIRDVVGDRVSLGFVLNEFAAVGIKFAPSQLTKSDIFSELLPLVNTRRVELLDEPRLRTQLVALERRARSGGKDAVDHPRGAHDDVANAAAGALTLVTGVGAQRKRQLVVRMGGAQSGTLRIGPGAERTPEQVKHAAMLDLIAATKAEAEQEAAADYALAQALEGDMSGVHRFLGGSTMTDGTWDALTGGDDLATRIGAPSPTLDRGTTLKRGAGR